MQRAHLRNGLLAAVLLTLAGCSSGTDTSGVASLASDATSAEGATTGESELTEARAIEFAQCMRDAGVEDFPDPTVDADGTVQLFGGGGGGPGGTAGDEDFEGAIETCSELLEGVTFGGGPGGPGGGDNTELQDALVAFTDCLRDEGLDVGDLDLGQPGEGAGPGGGGPPAGGGTGGGGGGAGQADGPGGFLAEALGLDPEDPDVAAALDACQPVLDEATAGFGPGANAGEAQ